MPLAPQYAPSQAIWLPITLECIRNISISFARMRDREDNFLGPLTLALDLVLGVSMFVTTIVGVCSFPPAILYREVMFGVIWALGLAGKYIKKWQIWRRAATPVKARVYIPVGHHEIECAGRKWLAGLQLPEGGGPVEHTSTKLRKCKVTYYPEGTLVLTRNETRLDFSDPSGNKWVSFSRCITVPGAWVCVEVGTHLGIKMSPTTMGTNLEGQFRVVHPVVDSRGVLSMLGDFKGGFPFAVICVCVCVSLCMCVCVRVCLLIEHHMHRRVGSRA
jgi:hypothetical protein